MFKIIGDIHRQMDPKEHMLVEILFKTFFSENVYEIQLYCVNGTYKNTKSLYLNRTLVTWKKRRSIHMFRCLLF